MDKADSTDNEKRSEQRFCWGSTSPAAADAPGVLRRRRIELPRENHRRERLRHCIPGSSCPPMPSRTTTSPSPATTAPSRSATSPVYAKALDQQSSRVSVHMSKQPGLDAYTKLDRPLRRVSACHPGDTGSG